MEGACLPPHPEPYHKLHEATETPEGIHFVLNDVEDRGEEVTHALDIAWGDTGSGPGPGPQHHPRTGPAPGPAPWCRTEVEVIHAVGEKDVVEQAQPGVVRTLVELVAPVCAAHISLCENRVQDAR